MRLAWPPPRHLTASILICIVAFALANLSPASWQEVASPLAALLAALAAGHLAVLSAYPGIFSLTMKRRALFTLLASALMSGLLSAVLTVTPRGLQPSSLATILSLLSIFLAAASYIRWSGQPRKRRFVFLSRRGMRSASLISAIREFRPSGRKTASVLIIFAAFVVIALAFSSGLIQLPFYGGLNLGEEGGSQDTDISSQTKLVEPSGSPAGAAHDDETQEGGQAAAEGSEESRIAGGSYPLENSPVSGSSSSISSGSESTSAVSSQSSAGSGGSGSGGTASTSSPQTSAKKATSAGVAASSTAKSETTEDVEDASFVSDAASSGGKDASGQKDALGLNNQSGEKNATSSSNLSANKSVNGSITESITESATESVSPIAIESAIESASESAGTSSPPSNSIASAATSTKASEAESQDSEEGSRSPASSGEAISGQVVINPESISKEGNQPPILKSLMADKKSPQEQGTSIFWHATAEDEEGDKVVYKFQVNGIDAKKWSKSSSWSWSTSNLPAGDYLITALARDENHASEDSFDSMMNVSFSLKATNQPPVVLELQADKSSPQSIGGLIIWTAAASDPDGDKVFYKFVKNGVDVTDWSESGFWSWDTTSEKKGDYVIAVLVRDGKHNSEKSSDGSRKSNFTLTVSNSLPVISDLKADPSGPYVTGDVINWSCTARDVEGDTMQYKFLVNGKLAQDWSPSPIWSWDTARQPAAEYKITAQVRDGKHASQSSYDSSKEVTVTLSRAGPVSDSGSGVGSGSDSIKASASNKAPELTGLKSDKSSPQAQGETIVWMAQADDEDGDNILYKFQVNGRDKTRWSEFSSWNWSTKGLAIGDYRIRVLVRDGIIAGESSFDGSLMTFTLVQRSISRSMS